MSCRCPTRHRAQAVDCDWDQSLLYRLAAAAADDDDDDLR